MAFDNNKLGELRPNQIITTFGPGSVVDAVKDSVTILDISYWKQKGQKIIDGRLASYLGVDCFYMPRTSFSGDVPVVTFPYWHVCSNLKCGKLFDARKYFDLDKYLKYGVTCPECHRPAYPSRFITICEDGHMSDFPWKWWVHRGESDCNDTLKMYSTGNTSTLADMWVECSCGAKRSMSGATQRDNFDGVVCSGHHPFRPNVKNHKCDKPLIPSQRGASNVYFAVSRSVISIPPWINPLYNLIDEHLRDIELAKQLMGDDGIMSGGNLNKEIFLNTVKSDAANGTANAVSMLKRSCPELSDAHCEDIIGTIISAMNMSEADKVSLVVTAPPSFAINARTTMNVVQSMINEANRNILITGYSLSSYFSELADTIIQKSQRGVFVKFFVNDIDKQPSFDKILRYKGRFLKIYNYRQDDDKMAALHAKVISVDQQQTLITSANLSYHGQQGNIELGTLIESKQIAKQIDDIFTKLIFAKDFCEI